MNMIANIMNILSTSATVFFLLSVNVSLASSICGDLDNGINGPFDYIGADRNHLKLVEDHHFTKNVERLNIYEGSAHGADLDYTLRAYPNHHRALDTMSRLAIRDKTPQPRGARYTTLCWFERAIRFKPNDVMVRLIFSSHLLKIDKLDMALEQLLFAIDLEPDNPLTAYNLGLIYLKKRDYEKAVHFAKKAYAQDFPLQGLKQQLRSAGRWRE